MTSQTLFTLEVDDASTKAQWRLEEIQLANWGTFDRQIYRIPVARRGHLFTGSSGSGKSSLLDGIAAVFTPDKWLRFNQAAQETSARKNQRSIVSYVRGAWVRMPDAEEDRLVTQYLRPKATWTGLILRFEKQGERPVSLARLFFAKGTGTQRSDISSIRILERSALDLRDLEELARGGLQTRAIKAKLPGATVTSTGSHQSFFTKMTSVFGMKSDNALQLLHKTQSTKNLGSLDRLFRDYMLDVPQTLNMADSAIEQFGQLSDAHNQVAELRKQRDHLLEVQESTTAFDGAQRTVQDLRTLMENMGPFRIQESLRLAEEDLERIGREVAAARESAATADIAYQNADQVFQAAQRRSIEAGGGDVEHLRQRIEESAAAAQATKTRFEALERELADVGIHEAPRSEAEFIELQTAIASKLESAVITGGPSHEEFDRASKARRLVANISKERESIRRTGSMIDRRLLRARQIISDGTGIAEVALPFAAELIEVKPEYEEWTGAIERVLRPLALTLLVRTENLAQVRRFVDDNHLATRLVYEEVGIEAKPPQPSRSQLSLVNRVSIKDGVHHGWLSSVLSERFDYACVESAEELGSYSPAVTVNGQIRTSKTKYIKDDRKAIDDRSDWILGDKAEKLEVLLQKLKAAESELKTAQAIVDKAQAHRDASAKRQVMLQSLQNRSWIDVDIAGAKSKFKALRHQYKMLCDSHGELASAQQALEVARNERKDAEDERNHTRDVLNGCTSERSAVINDISQLKADSAESVPPDVAAEIDRRCRTKRRSITRAQLPQVLESVQDQLRKETDRARTLADTSRERISALTAQFKETWRGVAEDLTTSVDDRHGYIEILNDIIARGLPDHEQRFLQLLRERSRDLVSELLSEIRGAPREVVERIEPINDSLRRSEFDPGRYLRLRVKTRRPAAATVFIEDLRSIVDESWGDADMDNAEKRFATLERLMHDLGSSDARKREWRTQCLDTRLHVSFVAEEVDEDGRTLASHDSGSVLSGGQQQKLVFFCLAAALRYQLTDADQVIPEFATVVMDEAFDKADFRYTKTALEIFREFGLQLVLATPHKLLQTIEPYIGGATEIENPDRNHSQVASVMWEGETP